MLFRMSQSFVNVHTHIFSSNSVIKNNWTIIVFLGGLLPPTLGAAGAPYCHCQMVDGVNRVWRELVAELSHEFLSTFRGCAHNLTEFLLELHHFCTNHWIVYWNICVDAHAQSHVTNFALWLFEPLLLRLWLHGHLALFEDANCTLLDPEWS